jgi:hypothetical protein
MTKALTIVLAFAAGIIAGRATTSSPPGSSKGVHAVGSKNSRPDLPRKNDAVDPIDLSSENIGSSSNNESIQKFISTSPRYRNSQWVRTMAEQLASSNPIEGLSQLYKNKESLGDDYHSVQDHLLTTWFLRNPESFFSNAILIEKMAGKPMDNINWLETAIKEDFDTVLKNWSLFPEREDRSVAASRIAQILAKESIGSALTWARSLAATERSAALAQVITAGSVESPAEVANLLQELPPGLERVSMVRTVAQSWAKKDLGRALDWLGSLSTMEEYDQAFEDVFAEMACQQPAESVKYAKANMDPAKDEVHIRRALAALAAENINAALEYSNSLQNETQSPVYTQTVLETWVRQDPKAAIRLILRDEAMTKTHLSSAISEASLSGPTKLIEMIDEIPAGEYRKQAIASASNSLWNHDSASARAWLESVKGKPIHDQVLASIIEDKMHASPDEMLNLTKTIEDSSLRAALSQRLREAWARID